MGATRTRRPTQTTGAKRTVYDGQLSEDQLRQLIREHGEQAAARRLAWLQEHPEVGDRGPSRSKNRAGPSPDDLHLTAEAIAAGRLLDLPVLDHIILGREGYVSLRDRGVSFDRR